MPKVSIIIPAYNAEKSIRRCLNSIQRQTFTDYEVIIQDGGSSDRTVHLITAYKGEHSDPRIDIVSEKDAGAYDAMNRGTRRATGEWLYFLGSDDELYNGDVIGNLVLHVDSQPCDVLYGNVFVTGDARWARDGCIYDGPFDMAKLLTKNVCHQAVIYRAGFLRAIGQYNQQYVVCADWDLNMRCWAKTQAQYVDLVVATFHAGGISTQDRQDVQFRKDVSANALRYFKLSAFDPLVNTPQFVGYSDIPRQQRLENRTRYFARRATRLVWRVWKRESWHSKD